MKIMKAVILISIVITMTTICLGTVNAQSDNVSEDSKETSVAASNLPENGDDVVALVNGKTITQKELDTYKSARNTRNSYSDKEFIIMLIKEKLLYEKATELGFTATNDEIADRINETKALFQDDNSGYEALKKLLKEQGISEDEYWNERLPNVLKTIIPVGKLNESLKEEYWNSSERETISFDDYYENYKENLFKQADVHIYSGNKLIDTINKYKWIIIFITLATIMVVMPFIMKRLQHSH